MSAPPLGSRATGPDAPRWIFGHCVRTFVGALLKAAYRVEVSGRENLPTEGGYVVAGNHVSYLDPMVVVVETPGPPHFMAKAEFFEPGKIMNWLLRRLWSFPVRRGEPDRESIARATALLKAGEVVGIFPEGRRIRPGAVDDEGDPQLGVAFIAMRADVPVVPVGVSGTDRALPPGAKLPRFPKIHVRYAKPVSPQDFQTGTRKEQMAAMTAEIMKRVAEERAKAEAGEA
jgi:1-acyl-sn-glycerol-3-phosphate acyltransferase